MTVRYGQSNLENIIWNKERQASIGVVLQYPSKVLPLSGSSQGGQALYFTWCLSPLPIPCHLFVLVFPLLNSLSASTPSPACGLWHIIQTAGPHGEEPWKRQCRGEITFDRLSAILQQLESRRGSRKPPQQPGPAEEPITAGEAPGSLSTWCRKKTGSKL